MSISRVGINYQFMAIIVPNAEPNYQMLLFLECNALLQLGNIFNYRFKGTPISLSFSHFSENWQA